MSGPAHPYPHLTDLLSEKLGGRALACSDDFFAGMDNLVRDAEPVFDPDAYYERGKVMDGWESRRKRGPGHDWCILALGAPGRIGALDIDTRHFTGNHAPYASVEATHVTGDPTPEQLRDEAEWVEVSPPLPMRLGTHNHVPVHANGVFTHVRLNIFPDGGVARLRVYGQVVRPLEGQVDLAALENGGKALACSDMYFGVMDNLIAPGRASDMREGWETRRRRGPGEDWVLLRLARRGILERMTIDTDHFKGNFPDTVVIEGIDWHEGAVHDLLASDRWATVLPQMKLSAHQAHAIDLDHAGPFTHLRMRIAPCGGVSRLRVYGRDAGTADPIAAHFDGMNEAEAVQAFLSCCGSERWARRMAGARPFHHKGALFHAARRFWWTASEADWHQAFSHHPRIGEDPERLRRKFAATADQSSREQAGVQGAPEHVLEALAKGNRDYEAKFGHVFLVCASGKSAAEMLHILQDRIRNTPERELREAAAAQAAITDLRLLAAGKPSS